MDLLDHYQQEGYVIVPDLIPHAKIDTLVERFERFKRGNRPFWSESIHTWMRPELDDKGFLVQSMENFTRLWFSGGLNEAGKDILLGTELRDVMRQLSPGNSEFVHWLNHMFDRSTGSIDHIDNWYLDSDPPGQLIGAWIALEDIHPDSGPFRLFPRSHLLPGLEDLWKLDHDAFIKHCAGLTRQLEPFYAIIKKGTVVFFTPFLLHGAVDQRDPRYSRKSVTGHYLPYGVVRRERFVQTEPIEVRREREMAMARTLGGRPIPVTHSLRDEIRFNVRGMTSYAKALMTGRRKVGMDMRRRSYSEL
jgi:phytanoyl-CoA hydroxylase